MRNSSRRSAQKNGNNRSNSNNQDGQKGRFIPRMIRNSDGSDARGEHSQERQPQSNRRQQNQKNAQRQGDGNTETTTNRARRGRNNRRRNQTSNTRSNPSNENQREQSSGRSRRQQNQTPNTPNANQSNKNTTKGRNRRGRNSSQSNKPSVHEKAQSTAKQRQRRQTPKPAAQLKAAKRQEGKPHMSPQVLSLKKGNGPSNKSSGRGGGRDNRRDTLPQTIDKPQENTRNLSNNSLKVIPLGGLCEIGKNMTALECGNDMIIIDIGIAFPEEHQPGIDSVIQDYSYVLQNKKKLRAIYLTHGHEDHIGALPFFVKQFGMDVKIFASPLTAELVKLKLADRGARQAVQNVQSVPVGETRKSGVFKVEFINMNHSIADACALCIDTPVGKVVHSGDFKIDYTPIHGQPADLARLTELGNEGVLLLLCESTNVERKGFSMSEKTVGEAFAEHFAAAKGRLFVATFSSNVSRVQQIITAAERFNRKVALVGRSMLNVFNAAQTLGYLKMKKDTIIELQDVDKYRPEEICIISTGSQGEPMSALTRMAFAEHRSVEIREGDTVIISATPIPGNEKPIFRVIDELYKRGAKVIYSSMAEVHVSGHGYREEIKLMHQLVKPKYFIPVHGEYRMLYMHAELAHQMGQAWESIYLLNNGDIFETTGKTARIGGYTQAGAILIDGNSSAASDSPVLQERRNLSDEGVVAITVAYDPRNGNMSGQPTVVTSGFVFGSDVKKLENDCRQFIVNYIKKNMQGKNLDKLVHSGQFRNQLQNFFYNQTRRRPVILLSTLDIRQNS